ncbi:energy transducer TonB [Sphingomonas sp.]|uniref:energy transducer TonB n=1 Tax=Sphingomonas sp. TaxID=28214 RepID=UPI0025FDDB44|nr:energy transducer TonB [Sphingomonas sp.]
MLAYAADMPRTAQRTGSPKALTLIVAGHALALAAVLTARPELVGFERDPPPVIINIPNDPPRPKPDPAHDPRPKQQETQDPFIPAERPIVDMGQATDIALDQGPPIRDILAGSGTAIIADPPRHVPVKLGPRIAMSEQALKPPYPLDKIRDQEEATLRLRLTIDPRGRVIAVDPVGKADPSFLEAARRHILKAWRYKPATEDGVAVQSTTVISLSFRLEDV